MEKLTQCKICGKEIAAKAKSCPHCGAVNNKSSNQKGCLLLVIILLFFCVIGTAIGNNSNNDSETANPDIADTSEDNEENSALNYSTDNIDIVDENQNNLVDDTDKEEPVVPETIEYEAVDIAAMLDDVDSNALRAEKTYQDKYIEITGKLSVIDSDGAYISIAAPDDEWGWNTVHCDITDESQLDVVLEKNKGDLVTITGQVTSIGEIIGYTVDIHTIK